MQTTDRQNLRQQLRAKRNALNPRQQAQASLMVLRHLMQLPLFMRAKNVALYFAMDGELDLRPVAEQLWKMGKQTYLPVLHPAQERQLWFVKFDAETPLIPNRFDIPEPDHQHHVKMPAHLLDVVLVPLVGFDRTGARLGMGGGFYDSTFAFHQHQKGKPYLIGIAHNCQEVETLTTEKWDIGMYRIVTDKEIITVD